MEKKLRVILPFTIIFFIIIAIYITRPIKIGVLFSLDSSLGNEQNLVCQFYVNKNRRVGLRRVKLYIESPGMDKEEIREAFFRLRDNDVSAIIGAALSFEGVIIAPLAHKYGIPILSPTTSTSFLTKKQDNFYQFIINAGATGTQIGRYLNEVETSRTAVILSESNREYSESLADAIIKEFKGETVKIFNNPQEPSFELLKEFNPGYIFFILPSGELISYLGFAKYQLPKTVLATSSWGYQQLLQVFSGPQLNGMVIIIMTDKEMEEPFLSESKEFEKLYKLKPTYIFGFAYTALLELYKALELNGSNRKKLISYFDTPRYFLSPYGKNYMNEYGDTIGQYYYVFEINDDNLIIKEKYKISEFPDEQ